MTGLRLIADDLTGALDSGCAFADADETVKVAVPGRALPSGPRIAVSTESRDMTEAESITAVNRAVRGLAVDDPETLWFKKIDSVMRGHPFAETKAAIDAGGFGHCVFAPAYPDMGRVTVAAQQYVVGAAGDRDPVGRNFREAFQALGLYTETGKPDGRRPSTTEDAGKAMIEIIAAETQIALDQDVRRMQAARRRAATLWVGAGGLAQALASKHSQAPFPPIHWIIVGTTHPATRRQTARAIADGIVSRRTIETTTSSGEETWLFAPALEAGNAEETAEKLRRHLPFITFPERQQASIIVTGGDTLSIVLEATEAEFLECSGQATSGVPVSRICGGRWHGVTLLSKSGGFGDDELFSWLIARRK